MRFGLIYSGTLVVLTYYASIASATEGTVARGMFGPRVMGSSAAPQPRMRFDRGIQRAPSGEIMGLQRSVRPRDSWDGFMDPSPLAHGQQQDWRSGYDPQAIRSAVPDVWPGVPTPAAPPVVTPPEVPSTAPPAVVPFRPARPPVVQPARPADTWFRGPRR
jgi:hypothetical protein